MPSSLDAQRAAIAAECDRKGWVLDRVYVYEDVASGKDANRPELVAARHALASGLVGGLVVTRLDRLSRSIADFAGVLDEAAKEK
jgi:DNA invertase Pin-like site-specific DNA recombinase